MLSSRQVRSLVAACATASLAAFLLHACSEQPTEPISEAQAARPLLTIGAGSSTANGTVTTDHGALSCSIAGSTAGASTSGACSRRYNPGTVVTLTATPASGSTLKLDQEWQGCVPTAGDRRVCQVTMNNDVTVAATFVPASNAFTLTVSGGAGGSGTVFSTPSGISCTITGGQASAGNCSAGFGSGTQVKLTANATNGSYLKAWAGGGCEVAGTGTGNTTGSCTTTISANVGVVVSFDIQTGAASLGQWAAPISWPAVAIHAVLLPTGKVMTWSRMDRVPTIWDPATGGFTSLTEPADLFCSGLTLLSDGKVFIPGGHSGVDNFGIKTAFTYDATSGAWFRAPDMRNGRWYPTATTLANGDALTISGTDTAAAVNLVPEVYQPTSNSWRALTTASRSMPYYPMMFAAPDGRVYYAGPEQATAFLSPSGSGSWAGGPPHNCCYRDYGAAVMYDVGQILVVGGGSPPTRTAERIDVGAPAATWINSGTMSVGRRQTNATLLADGTVLVTGGTDATGFNTFPTSSAVLAAELWNPATPTVWKKLASMTHYRLYHSTALLLPDGRVLSAGSGSPPTTGLTDDYTAEIFSPPYLFKPDGTPATRPVITSAPATIPYSQVWPNGQTFTIQTPDAASIVKVTLIRLSAVTHSFNQNQRGNVVAFSAGSGSLTISAPLNSNMAPPGHYMLFIINGSGVPSVAKIVYLN